MGRPISITRALVGIAAIATACAAGATQGDTFGRLAPESLSTWKAFRVAQPFQTQLIAVSPPAQGRARTLIIAEPPPGLTWARVPDVLGTAVAGCSRQRWSFMAGGEVRDIVCTLRSESDRDLSDTLTRLQIELFGTSAMSEVIQLPAPARRMTDHSLDLRYGATDLSRWIHEVGPKWRAGPLAPAVSLAEILDGRAKGVFADDSNSLVVWTFEPGTQIDGSAARFRQFAIQSDLILGAVSSSKAVLVVGRARVESLAHLPPLRSETMLLLAGSPEHELAQSYERLDMLAGKGPDGFDRAPILLSRQLVDTEFGNLLNVADQLLKGWSQAGHLRYRDFQYPAPRSYPFGDLPASHAEPGRRRESFLFNWNTDGATYVKSIDGLEILAPQRTGALSVIYGDPVDRPRKLENTAYDYFAGSGDASLTRVVQYTLLYQIFRHFDAHASPPPVSPRFAEFHAQLDKSTRQLVRTAISNENTVAMNGALRAYWTAFTARMPDSTFAEMHVSRADAAEGMTRKSLSVLTQLRAGQSRCNGKLSEALSDFAAMLRLRQKPSPADKVELQNALETMSGCLPPELFNEVKASRGQNLSHLGIFQAASLQLGTWTALAEAGGPSNAWNHTAYVVQSQGIGEAAAAIGGHNLDSQVIRFKDSSQQAAGTVSVERDADGSLVITSNPSNANQLREISREVGTRKELAPSTIEAEVNAQLRGARPAPPVALKDIRSRTAVASARTAEFKFAGGSESAYRTRPLDPREQQVMASLESSGEQAIIFQQLDDGSFQMSRTGSGEVLHVASLTAATDALSNGLLKTAGGRAPVTVLLKGVPPAKSEAMMGFIQSNLRRYPEEHVQYVLNTEGQEALIAARPRLLNARIAHNGVRVEPGEVSMQKVVGGVYDGYTRVEVPVTIQAKTPWRLRLIFFIKDLAAGTKERLVSKISTVLASMRGSTSVAELNATIRDQLGADFKELGVSALITRVDSAPVNELHDITVAGREPAVGGSWPDENAARPHDEG